MCVENLLAVMQPVGFSLVCTAIVAGALSVGGASHGLAPLPAGGASPTVFRDIARRENPAVVSITTRKR
jgi:hypothetical protein